jgi:small subunit ribosomal protein S21
MYDENISWNNKNGILVIRRENEDIDSLIKRFKKKVNNSGILRELKKYSAYEKPSIARKRKRKEAQIRREKESLKLEKKRSNSGKNEKHSCNK